MMVHSQYLIHCIYQNLSQINIIKITKLDMVTNTTYYYIVTQADETAGKYQYYLSDFIKMGSTNEPYVESNAYNNYYDSTQDVLYEKYIFHIDFSEANEN